MKVVVLLGLMAAVACEGGDANDQEFPDAADPGDGFDASVDPPDATIEFDAAVFDHSLRLDGLDDIATVPFDSAFAFTGPFTVEMWVFPESGTGGFVSRWGPGNEPDAFAMFTGDSGVIGQVTNSDGRVEGNFAGITLNDWNHVAMVYSSAGLQLFVNGVGDTPVNATGVPALEQTQDIVIGLEEESGTQQLQGFVDELRMWNVARSAADIAASFDKEIDPTTANLVGYWKFDEDPFSQVILDSTPNALHGFLGATNSPEADDPGRSGVLPPLQ